MKKKYEITIPHFLILDENKINNFTPENLSSAMLSIVEKLKKYPTMTHGIIMAKIKSTGEEVPICWYTNNYSFEFNIKIGQGKDKDSFKIFQRLSEHLLMTSLELTIEDTDELMAEFDKGMINFKFGEGLNKRIYKIEYEQENSNFDIAMNEINEEINEYDQKNFKPTLH